MANRDPRRNMPLSGDDRYGERELLRGYRDFERDEHRRFRTELEREERGRYPRIDRLVDYDHQDADLTGGHFDPERRHATEGGYQYRVFGEWTPAEEAKRAREESVRNRGRGPRNYQRSDDRIREEVCERLTDDERIDPSDVEVTVADGEVTLTGTLRSRNAKRHATDLADSVKGVKDVHNRIRVSDEQVWPPK